MKTTQTNQVAALEKLLSHCNAHGPVYNPSKASIKVAAIGTLLTQAREKEQAAYVSRTAFQNAVIVRSQAFDTLPELLARITGALEANGANAELMENVTAIKRRFYSKRKASKSAIATESGSPAKGISTSQLDYESKASNFSQLVTLLTAQAVYAPNEADLKVTALKAFADTLRSRNKAVVDALTNLKSSQSSRRQVLYGTNGVYETGKATKAYIKSLFGRKSEQYAQVKGIRFFNLKPM